MTQYLLSVWHDKDATPEDIYPDAAEREASYAATGEFNEELQASGNWVFAGGLHSAEHRDRRRRHRRRARHHRRPVQRVQGADRRLLGRRGRRPRRRHRRWPPAGRRPAGARSRCAPSRASEPARPTVEVEAVYRAEFGRVVASLTGRFGDLDLAEEMAQEAFVEAVRRWPTEGVPPNPGGWLTVVARNKALDRLRRESTRQARHEEAEMLTAHEDPARPGHLGDRRAAPAALHLLPPGARPRGAGRADPAAARWPHRARGGERLPRARAHDGAADHPSQAQDRRREHPLPGAARPRAARAARGACSPWSTSSSPRATCPGRAATASATTCAPRRSGSAGCCAS